MPHPTKVHRTVKRSHLHKTIKRAHQLASGVAAALPDGASKAEQEAEAADMAVLMALIAGGTESPFSDDAAGFDGDDDITL